MAALAADRHTPTRDGVLVATQAAAAKIYAGALVMIDGGYAKPGATAANKKFWGRAEEYCDNSGGAAGDKSVLVRRGVAFLWANAAGAGAIAQAEVGSNCYIADDQTVTKTAAGATVAGVVIEVTGDGVWVL